MKNNINGTLKRAKQSELIFYVSKKNFVVQKQAMLHAVETFQY
jgi:hypothetical protein